jgi:hypothetical protein
MLRSNTITHKTATKSILDLKNLYDHGNLNLEPGFQRQSVWTERDRAKLIDSILRIETSTWPDNSRTGRPGSERVPRRGAFPVQLPYDTYFAPVV